MTPSKITDRLNELQAIADKATPGPWEYDWEEVLIVRKP